MCENCKEVLEDNKLTEDMLYEDDYAFEVEPIIFNKENLVDVVLDDEKFQDGLDDISFVCGQITGLINIGIDPVDALNYLVNKDVLKNNLEMGKINKETSIKVAQEQSIQVEKNSL